MAAVPLPAVLLSAQAEGPLERGRAQSCACCEACDVEGRGPTHQEGFEPEHGEMKHSTAWQGGLAHSGELKESGAHSRCPFCSICRAESSRLYVLDGKKKRAGKNQGFLTSTPGLQEARQNSASLSNLTGGPGHTLLQALSANKRAVAQ